MRKYVLGILLMVLAIICFLIIGFGVKIGAFKIYSYSDVSKASKERKSLLTSLNEKNITEYEETDFENRDHPAGVCGGSRFYELYNLYGKPGYDRGDGGGHAAGRLRRSRRQAVQ